MAPHELVLFPETADLPVEWAVLGRDPGRPGRVLVVPADTYTKQGTGDLALPDGSPLAPLTLRCAFGAWIDETRLRTARRTEDVLDPEAASAARQIWDARERGEPVGSLLTEEVDADPEYRDWIEEFLVPARAALTAAPAAARVVPMRRRPAYFGNPFAIAASVLLVASLGLAAGLVWQDRRIEEERARTQDQLRQERERLTGELRRAEEAHRRELTAAQRRAEESRQRDQERIAALEQRLQNAWRPESLLNVPLAGLAPKGPVRGPIKVFTLPAKADLYLLLLAVKGSALFPSYRLDILSKDTDRVFWTIKGLEPTGELDDVSLLLRRNALPPGDYQLRLYGLKDGKSEPAGDYELRIVHQ